MASVSNFPVVRCATRFKHSRANHHALNGLVGHDQIETLVAQMLEGINNFFGRGERGVRDCVGLAQDVSEFGKP